MNKRVLKDIKIGIVGGLLGFFLIVLPMFKLVDYIQFRIIPEIQRFYDALIYDLYN